MTTLTASRAEIQEEAVSFRSPGGENIMKAIGANINYILGQLVSVGSVEQSFLTLADFQTQKGSTNWLLADGGDCTGTLFATLFGSNTLPDLRGSFLRAKDNSKGLNPDGDLALGAYTVDKYKAHTHTTRTDYTINAGSAAKSITLDNTASGTAITGSSGGNETAPKSVTVNMFIKVDY
jgi:hypothetical protein